VFDIIEFQEDLIGMDHRASTVLPAIVGEDILHSQPMVLIEGKGPVIEDIHRGFRDLRGVGLAKGKGTVSVHHSLKADSANALEGADKLRRRFAVFQQPVAM